MTPLKTRGQILNQILRLNTQIEDLQKEINQLCDEAEAIIDEDDDKHGRDSYLSCIKSYETFL